MSRISIGKSVLDMGTGETGVLAYYLKARGAKHVVACEKSILALKKAFTASDATKQEIAGQYGWRCRVVARRKRVIRKGGETEKNLGWIQKTYPKYKFKSVHGQLHHHMLVVEFIQF